MQKKIIALAIAGLSSAAFAQSNVQIYGNVDASMVKYSGTSTGVPGAAAGNAAGNGSITKIDSNLIKQSRIGFRGNEDLGGGMKAVWTAEASLASDGGAAAQQAGASGLGGAWRQMFVGVEGNFGSATAGRMYTPFFKTVAAVDNFNMTGVGAVGNIHPIAAQTARFSSSINYTTPSFNGLTASVMMGMSEVPSDSTTKPKGESFNVVYANGPIVASAAHLKVKDADLTNGTGNSTGTTGVLGTGATAAYTAGLDIKANVFGGTYDFGMAKVGAAYVTAKATNAGATALDNKGWTVNATVPFGAHAFKIQHNRTNDKLASNEDATHWGLGFQYNLSKRTSLQAQYGKVSNKNGATYGVDPRTTLGATGFASPAVPGVAGATSREKGLVFGMNHDF